jgi:hypothetical protein
LLHCCSLIGSGAAAQRPPTPSAERAESVMHTTRHKSRDQSPRLKLDLPVSKPRLGRNALSRRSVKFSVRPHRVFEAQPSRNSPLAREPKPDKGCARRVVSLAARGREPRDALPRKLVSGETNNERRPPAEPRARQHDVREEA